MSAGCDRGNKCGGGGTVRGTPLAHMWWCDRIEALEAALAEHHLFDSRGMCRVCDLPTLSAQETDR